MVFSFFTKKPPEKMISKPAAVPRANAERGEATPLGGEKPTTGISEASEASVPATAPKTSGDEASLDFSDFVFSESSPDFQIEADIDPIDAVTFEVSPPSWEPKRVAAPEPMPQTAIAARDDAIDAYVLRGDVKASRFGDLPAYAEVHDPVLIDCAELKRMDFISAGALLNQLTTIRRTGRQIVFRYPNYLVAELFGVVGLKAVATIIFAKH